MTSRATTRLSQLASCHLLGPCGGALLIAGAVLGILAAVSYTSLGSVEAGLRYLAGERLILDQRTKYFGEFRAEETERTVVFRVLNLTGRPVRIVGARSSCTCAVAGPFPITIPQSARAELPVNMRRGRELGNVAESVSYYIDTPQQPLLVVRLVGRIPKLAD